MHNQIQIPPEELSIFHAMPDIVQRQINRRLPVMQELLNLQSGKGIKAREAARQLGIPLSTLRGYLTAVRKHGWRGLIDKNRLGTATLKVRAEFLPTWHAYIFANQRNTKKAHQKMCGDAAHGKSIPGYADWTRWPEPPPGLTYRNLTRRRYMPSRSEITLAREGIAAARKFLPHCLQDVSELKPLRLVAFDDVELDFLVCIPGLFSPVKLRMIVAFDVCTRRILGYGVRPAIPRPDGVEDGLKLRDMKAVVVRLLRTYGVPTAYPMCLLVERGTAAIPDAVKQALAHISGGQITVSDTSMIGGQILEFRDKATGNSWGKAWLESFFNPLHGELAHLGGQKGLSYSRSPAELDGRRKELGMLIRAGRALTIHQRAEIRLPFKSLEEAVTEFEAALHRLDRRGEIPGTSHNLQGFAQVQLWQTTPDDSPKPLSELPDYLLDKTASLLWSSRIESPRERWERLIVDCARRAVPESGLHVFLDDQRLCRFADMQFRFDVAGTNYVYLTDDNLIPRLTEGEKYVLWFHPQDMGTVYITRPAPHLGYIGKLTRFERTRRGDLEAAKEQIKQVSRFRTRAIERVQDAGLEKLQDRAADIAAHAEVFNHAAELESERARLEVVATTDDMETMPAVAAAIITDRNQRVRTRSNERHEKNLAELAESALSELSESGH